MKRYPRTRKTSVNLSESISRQLNMYALAAGPAGVGLLALAQPAEAKIVYTPADIVIGNNDPYNFDLNHDGVTDFILANSYSCDLGCHYFCVATPLDTSKGNAVDATGRFYTLARALHYGARIGPNDPFPNFNAGMVDAYNGASRTYLRGFWINVRSRYLGLRFNIEGKIHYGWARLSVKVSEGSKLDITARLTGYAYETIPNKPIIAGKTEGPDLVTVQPDTAPATLGWLAQGRK